MFLCVQNLTNLQLKNQAGKILKQVVLDFLHARRVSHIDILS